MYLGKGTEKEYEGKDVTGKLVLVDMIKEMNGGDQLSCVSGTFKRRKSCDRSPDRRIW